jgi:hypothetical protein
MFPALSVLEKRALPTSHGHLAYWRAPIPAPAQGHIHIPSWSWTGIRLTEYSPDETVTLDVNGSYMAALGGVDIAFTELKRMGPMDVMQVRPREVLPGYYRITTPGWALGGTIVSPLGDKVDHFIGKPMWIAHPTLILLLELMEQQVLGYFEIMDSWVSAQATNFRDWNRLLKQTREALMDDVDRVHPEGAPSACKCSEPCLKYRAFKEGYGAAFSLMRTGERCKVRRPDWADAVYAQHAAARWRNAWRFTEIGPLLFMGSTDELTVTREDLAAALARPKLPPLKLDESGRLLGHYKTKAPAAGPTPDHQDAAATPYALHLANPYEDNDIL